VARKKKNKDIPSRDLVLSWNDWNAGDVAWAKTYATGKNFYGEIIEFYLNDKAGVAVALLDESGGCFRTVLADSLSESDPRKIKKLRRSSIKRKN
tara:strand:- start:7769 stop:8053 length:285 start_codon:yes stop_codon:yes gene_type:complete